MANYFGDGVAEFYDDDCADVSTPDALAATVDFLASRAANRRALELAIGTGRVALPLATAGIAVTGIELSTQMLAQLRHKPGGDETNMPVVVGDMTTTEAPGCGTFSLVYLVFNTIMNVRSQSGQVECFRNAERHLAPGGVFVIEVGVPQLRRLPPGQRFVPFDVSDEHLGFDEYETVSQTLTSHHVTSRSNAVERASQPFRYVWPAELDLMAQLAGLTFAERYADWDKSPFTESSESHVSVWGKPLP